MKQKHVNEWMQLEKECASCKRCVLWENRKHVVLDRGDRQADLMLIGEAPGEEEDSQGRAFVGRAGQLLSMALTALGLSDKQYYLCNVVKCRPQNNRTPFEEEIASCRAYLEKQIDLVQPKVIVMLGNVAASSLLGRDIRITRDRGLWDYYKGIPVMLTFHPAALLRDESKKIFMWRDIKSAWMRLNSLD